MPVLLRDLLDRHIEAVLLEDACLVCERERRKAGPSRDADADLHVLCDGWCGHQKSSGCRQYSKTTHGCIPLLVDRLRPVRPFKPVRAMLFSSA
jgi:hypothetical protein